MCHSLEHLLLLSTVVNASYLKDLFLNKKFFLPTVTASIQNEVLRKRFQAEHRVQ